MPVAGHRAADSSGAESLGSPQAGCVPSAFTRFAKSAPDDGTGDRLRDYQATKLAVAGHLRLVREALHQRGDELRERQCEELLGKLADDRFTLAVLGQFKRGKSSLLNALVGRNLLPVGVLPVTSAITALRYGARERLIIERWSGDRTFATEEPAERLAEFVSERGNPGNRLRVKMACLELPARFLRQGVEFVDTPGVGSPIEANTATTRSFLSVCDAALFVTSAEAPPSEGELSFLWEIQQHLRKVFFVINKIDLLATTERSELVDYTTRILRENCRTPEIRVFAVSSRDGLEGSRLRDEAMIRQSGLSALQDALAEFLTWERNRTFLTALVEKVGRLLDRATLETSLAESARTCDQGALHEKRARLERMLRGRAEARREIVERLRVQVIQATKEQIAPQFQTGPMAAGRLTRQFSALMGPFSWQPVRPALRRIGPRLTRLHTRSQNRRLNEAAVLVAAGNALSGAPAHLELTENLSAIGREAAEAFALKAQTAEGENVPLPPWSPVNWEKTPAVEDWLPNLSRTITGLPLLLVRHRLKAEFRRSLPMVLDAHGLKLTEWAARCVGREMDAWTQQVEAVAEKIESRLVSIVGGDALKESKLADLGALRRQLGELLGKVSGGDGTVAAEQAATSLEVTSRMPSDSRPASRVLPSDSFDLRRGSGTRGCIVCDRLAQVTAGILAHLQYELYASGDAQSDYAEKGDLCPLHLWQLEAVSSPVGVSVGHALRVENVARILDRAAKSAENRRDLALLIPHAHRCRVCAELRAAEAHCLEQIVAELHSTEGKVTYAGSQGPCLRHLVQLVALAKGDGALEAYLLSEAARHFMETAEDMRGFGLKTEALRRELRNENEEDAWWRALTHLAGARRVTCALTCDGDI